MCVRCDVVRPTRRYVRRITNFFVVFIKWKRKVRQKDKRENECKFRTINGTITAAAVRCVPNVLFSKMSFKTTDLI